MSRVRPSRALRLLPIFIGLLVLLAACGTQPRLTALPDDSNVGFSDATVPAGDGLPGGAPPTTEFRLGPATTAPPAPTTTEAPAPVWCDDAAALAGLGPNENTIALASVLGPLQRADDPVIVAGALAIDTLVMDFKIDPSTVATDQQRSQISDFDDAVDAACGFRVTADFFS